MRKDRERFRVASAADGATINITGAPVEKAVADGGERFGHRNRQTGLVDFDSQTPPEKQAPIRERVPIAGVMKYELTFEDDTTLFLTYGQFILILHSMHEGQRSRFLHFGAYREKVEFKNVRSIRAFRETELT